MFGQTLMEGKAKKKPATERLSARKMGVSVCPLGTGIVLKQERDVAAPFTAHLTPSEARELAHSLLDGIAQARRNRDGYQSVSSLFACGLRIDEIAYKLNLPLHEVKRELIARRLLPETESA